MKVQISSILLGILIFSTAAFAQEDGHRYSEYWQSYQNVEKTYPTGYASDKVQPRWAYQVKVKKVVPNIRECDSPYPMPGTWEKHNNSMAFSTYKKWGENKDGYDCERFLTKPFKSTVSCSGSSCTTPGHHHKKQGHVTFRGAHGSDIYLTNNALIDDLKAMYCLPSHIIYRLKSRNDAAYNRAKSGGSPAMPGRDHERSTLQGIHNELVKLRATCVDGGVR